MGRETNIDDFLRYRDFFDSVCVIPLAVVGPDGALEYFNRKAEETFGYTHSELPDLDHWWRVAYPDEQYREETKRGWLAMVEKARQGNGELEPGEYRVTCKDASVKICKFFGSVVHGKAFIMLEDITERANAVEALRASEGRLWNILDNSPVPMAIQTVQGKIEYLNDKYTQTYGYSVADTPDRETWILTAAPDEKYRGELGARFDAAFAGAAASGGELKPVDFLFSCKNGDVKNVSVSGILLGEKIFAIFEDTTERFRTLEALRQSETLLRRIIEQAPMAMSIVALDGTIEFINRKAEAVFGYPHADIPNMDRWWVQAYPDEAHRKEVIARYMGHVYEAMEKGGEIAGEEYLVTCKDGSKKTCYIFGVIAGGKVFVMFDDITGRVETEKALRASEGTLRRILDLAPVAISVQDTSGNVQYCNRKFSQVFGYAPEDTRDFESFRRAFFPDEAYSTQVLDTWKEWVENSLATGREMPGGQFRISCKDGTIKTAAISGMTTPDKKVISIFEDITERAEAERALRERESLYRSLIETTGTGYVVLDGHGNVVDANREYVRLSGHSDLKEIMGHSVLEWSAPHSKERAREAINIVIREGRLSNFELDYVRGTGKLTTVELNATVVSRGGVQQILGLCRDISARSRTEAELRDSESLYRALVETTRTGYVVVDTAGKVLDANREYVRLSGHSDLKEILGRSAMEWTAPDKKEQNAAAVAQCARDGHIFNYETDYMDKAGKRYPVEINATVVSRGGIPQIHTLCRDISQRRRRDQELSLLNQSLERRVEERTAELMKANIELSHEVAQRMDAEKEKGKLQEELLQSQKLEVVGRLAGGIAHDFNNILVAISGYAEFLMKTMPPDAPARADLEEIILETERGALLTHQLTAIGRKQPLEPKVLSLNETAEDTCRMLKRLIGANMHLELRLAPALENIKADPGQVSQVVMNLIVNARDAMPDGGNITVSTANEEVTPATDGMRLPPKPGHYVTLTVSDTGTGMTPETAARVFEPFFTTKEQGQGTGLGLSTVHSIMLQTNGGIALKTSPGKGTAFKIYFPRTLERA